MSERILDYREEKVRCGQVEFVYQLFTHKEQLQKVNNLWIKVFPRYDRRSHVESCKEVRCFSLVLGEKYLAN